MKQPRWPDPKNSKVIELGLDRVFKALERLDNPHLKTPPVIHVAGTNGKGSTIAYVKSILEKAGKKCHVYISPHLVEFNERIVLAGKQISEEFLDEIIEETRKKCEGINLTFFEGTTVAAFLAFSKVKADYLLLEVGLGGRLDATNVVPKPLLAIITPVSYDHMEFLGETIEKIAFEKASIIKENVPCVVSKQSNEVMKVVNEYAKKKNSEVIIAEEKINFKPSLAGEHQYTNAATAFAAAQQIGIDEKYIEEGIRTAIWPARLQKLSENIYLDGGHNADAGKVICDFVKSENDKNKKYNIAVIGMIKTKDFAGFIKNLSPAFDEVYAVPVPNNECRDPQEIKNICDELKLKCEIFNSPEVAIKKADKKDNRVIICGSLYLAGYILENFRPDQQAGKIAVR